MGHEKGLWLNLLAGTTMRAMLERWIDAFGVERVIAGTDCGFASFAGNDEIHETIVWAKFDALVKGTQIASKAATPSSQPGRVRSLKKYVLNRDGWKRQNCGTSANLQVHHLVYRSQLGPDGD